jgi:hypothetical protein
MTLCAKPHFPGKKPAFCPTFASCCFYMPYSKAAPGTRKQIDL